MSDSNIDVTAFRDQQSQVRAWSLLGIAGVLLFIGLLIVPYVLLKASDGSHLYKQTEGMLGLGEIMALALSVVAIFRRIDLTLRYRRQTFATFLKRNKWAQNPGFDLKRVPSILLGKTYSYEQYYSFGGSYHGHRFTCLLFQFETEEKDSIRFICLNFKLPKSYPMIVLDNTLNNPKYRFQTSNLPNHVVDGMSLRLEGNFNEYYYINTTQGAERSVVQVLSPDLMSILIDQAPKKVDVEINDKDIFFMYEDVFYTEQNINALFGVATTLLPKMDRMAKSWLASSRDEEKTISAEAKAARYKLLTRVDYISVILFIITFTAYILYLIDKIMNG